jgi:DNA topoisomerase-2
MPPKKTIEETYKSMSQYEHILHAPDTYIGSIEKTELETWVYAGKGEEGGAGAGAGAEATEDKMEFRNISYIPGFYKIFDEILVNAIDQYTRTQGDEHIVNKVTMIKVGFDVGTGMITVFNNGEGIPIEIHKEQNVYVPEMIFGTLLSGSNYDKDEEKTTGGKNGYGAKLANIYSKRFVIETVDSERKLKYVQVFEKNMSLKHPPVISKCSSKPYTKIEFIPDLERFGLERLDSDDTLLYMKKRVFDATACTGKTVTVYLDDRKLDCKSLEKYVGYYLGSMVEKVYEEVNDRWELVIAVSPDQKFDQMSFVNGVATIKGGKHVDNVVTTVTNKLIKHVASKRGKVELKPSHVKENMFVFVRSVIVNPAFDSQTKEYLTTPATKFGSKCEVSDKFIEKLTKTAIVERAQKLTHFKETLDLQKVSGRKVSRINVPKLDDANMAGTAESRKCTLILTEGDSAKALAVSGLSVVGRDYFGAFPLKGKPLNVRDVKPDKVRDNAEIANIVKILGLKFNVSNKAKSAEETLKELRYGHILVFADQDDDGEHIKGLLINFFDVFWPELGTILDFVTILSTPILKAFKGSMNKPKEVINFYTKSEYEEWEKLTNGGRGYEIKYYKGLGTSTAQEAKEYFKDFDKKKICYFTGGSEEETRVSRDALDLAFNSKRAEDRKAWLGKYDRSNILEQSQKVVRFDEFVNKGLIHFSEYDNHRSIPSVCDGFKPSQRKVFFAALKRNMVNQVKVAQFAGYVSEHSGYHHGEASLNGAIVKMAQDYVGSNNINLLMPDGQFGTRLMGGKDSASERYIFTRLNVLAKMIFNEQDTPLLKFMMDDGDKVEPEYYVPILPMILVNGTTGIGTGYSTDVPMHNPLDVIAGIEALMEDREPERLKPWYRGFTGKIEPTERSEKHFINKGVVRVVDDTTIEITELPIEVWTSDYKIYLEALIVGSTSSPSPKAAKAEAEGKAKSEKAVPRKSAAVSKQVIQSFKEYHTDATVRFEIKMKKEDVEYYREHMEELEDYLKLTGRIQYTNMTLYDPKGHLKKYDSTDDVLKEFYMVRLTFYTKRRTYQMKLLRRLLNICEAKVRFIEEIISKTLDIMYKENDAVIALLEERGYPKFSTEERDMAADGPHDDQDYEYLLTMHIRSLTKTKLDQLRREYEEKLARFKELEAKDEIQLWKDDLGEFKAKYAEMMAEYEERYEAERKAVVAPTGAVKKKRAVATVKKTTA